MKKRLTAAVFLLGLGSLADADVWKWVDALGNTHFVDTMKPIYTWVDDEGKVHYADQPGHEDAVSVQLVWHAKGDLEKVASAESKSASDGYAYPGETAEQRAERERAEAYYCNRATEIYNSYVNAPQLYKTNENGEREYLSKEEAARTIAETRAKKDELCE
ncbi:MAG: DUF4124 domain-containing protein [Gammaproteobacteria bacterium]|nr:DUF4124 domain-containing protein [Gammaproteobacteria bacterium]MDH5302494.1 DUF4124 domain-containing protein [Gammaproteobacteria bacterium]MDH5321376.1 DUF4124 domain-containing protein [Gammaproteobacteria bacterium]